MTKRSKADWSKRAVKILATYLVAYEAAGDNAAARTKLAEDALSDLEAIGEPPALPARAEQVAVSKGSLPVKE